MRLCLFFVLLVLGGCVGPNSLIKRSVIQPAPRVIIRTVYIDRPVDIPIPADKLTISPDPAIPFTGNLQQWGNYGAAQKAVADECRAKLESLSN